MMIESNDEFTGDYFLSGAAAPVDMDKLASPGPSTLRSVEEASILPDFSDRILFEEDLTVPSREEVFTTPLLRRSRKAQLNGVNFLNVVTYAAHLFVSWGVGVWGLDGIVDTRVKISLEYKTLVTPVTWAYWIWYPILVMEAIFALAQLLPHYRARPIVQAGTGYFFFYTFLIQTAWTLFFAFKLFVCSFIAVVLALLSLLKLLRSQHNSLTRGESGRLEYFLFRFPFFLHTGWMIVVTLQHFSLMFRSYDCDVSLQLAVDVVCLALLLPVAVFALAGSPIGQDFVIPFVVVWAYTGIACRLSHPSDELLLQFGHTSIEALRIATFFFIGVVGCCLVPNVVVWVTREFFTINVVELDG